MAITRTDCLQSINAGAKAKVSVVIPTCNRPDSLRDTLQSYLAADPLPDEIIIVDQSGSPADQLCHAVATALQGTTRIIYIHLSQPSSTRARNAGLHESSNDIVIFSDDDVEIGTDTIAQVAHFFHDGNIALLAAPDLSECDSRPPTRKRILFEAIFGRRPMVSTDGRVMRGAMLGRYPYQPHEQVSTEWAMGYFFAIRKSLVQSWGIAWDETLTQYAYAEDLDFSFSYCKRAREYGYVTVLAPQVKVKHLVSREWRIPSNKHSAVYVVNRYYLSYKHFRGWWYRLLLLWSDIAVVILRIKANGDWRIIVRAHGVCLRKRNLIMAGSIDSVVDMVTVSNRGN